MKFSLTYIINLLLATTSKYPAPGPCTGDCWAHDPSLYQRQTDRRYFRFSSQDGIHIHEADSISGPWKATGVAFANGSIIQHRGRTKLWAPDVHYEPELKKYHMYYAVSTRGSHDSVIGVASSPDMTPGSWADHGAVLHSTDKSRYNAIDANWISVNGKPYINFGSYWDGIFQVPLEMDKKDPNKVTIKVEPGRSGAGPSLSNLAYNATGNHHIEGAFMFKHQEWFFLLFSSGKANGYEKNMLAQGEEYRIVMCRSKSSEGDFVDKAGKSCLKSGGTTLLASHENIYGPGGQGVFEDKEYGHVLYYHYADKNIGMSRFQYQLGWNRLEWKESWPIVV
ncbi:hypothetical protein BDV06DRAFT_231655 [Aspergillus oleicola]